MTTEYSYVEYYSTDAPMVYIVECGDDSQEFADIESAMRAAVIALMSGDNVVKIERV